MLETKRTILIAATLALPVVVGCGSSGRPTVRVTGKVVYQDHPVANAHVTFLPEEGPLAVTTTDADGKFVFETVLGKHVATVTPATPPPADSTGLTEADYAEPDSTDEESGLPRRYADADESGLLYTVQAGVNNEFTLKLD